MLTAAYSGSSSGGGQPVVPTDPFATSRSAFANFINSGGVDIGAMKEALGGYRTLAESGGFTPEQRAALEASAGRQRQIGETGGYSPDVLNRINSNIDVLSVIGQTGGFSPEALGVIRGDLAGLRSIGQTGGISPEDLNRARGYGQFENFARTGGYSPADITNIRQRATSPINSLYATDMANIERSNRLLGTAAPNYAASVARLGRNRGMSLADAARNAEIDLQSQIRSGQMEGARAGSAAELQLQDILNKNRLAGLSASAEGEASLANAVAQNQLAGASGASTQLQNLQNAITDAQLRGNTSEAQILGDLYNSIASNQLGALGGITQTQQGAEEIAQRGRLAGAEGMLELSKQLKQLGLRRLLQERKRMRSRPHKERLMNNSGPSLMPAMNVGLVKINSMLLAWV